MKISNREIIDMCEMYNIDIIDCLSDIERLHSITRKDIIPNKKSISRLIRNAESLIEEKGILCAN